MGNHRNWFTTARDLDAQLPVVARINRTLTTAQHSDLWVDDGWVKLIEAPTKAMLDHAVNLARYASR